MNALIRLKSFLFLAAVFAAFGWSGSAQATNFNSSFSNLNTPGATNPSNQQVTLSGHIAPCAAGRPVSLYDAANNFLGGTTAGSGCNFSITVTLPFNKTLHFYSAKQTVGSNSYLATNSGNFFVEAQYNSAFSEMSTPGNTNSANQLVVLSGRVLPTAGPRTISLYDSRGTYVQGTTTDGNGYFSMTVAVPVTRAFHFFSAGQDTGTRRFLGVSTGDFTVQANYDSSFSQLNIPAGTDPSNQQITVSGRIQPAAAGRVVHLRNPADINYANATTDANGFFSMTLTIGNTQAFHFYSAQQDVPGQHYLAVNSSAFTIESRYASTFSNLSTPLYTNSGDQQVALSGRIQPAAAGRTVSLYDSSNNLIAGTTADAAGNFSMIITVNAVTTFHFYSFDQVVGNQTYFRQTSTDFTVRSLRLWDQFEYSSVSQMQPKWSLRRDPAVDPTNFAYREGNMSAQPPILPIHTISSWDAISFAGTGNAGDPKHMVFSIVADGSCSSGHPRFKLPHITVGNLGITYGHLEARIKFQRPKGAHGALWWQSGYGAGGGEFDVAEFFGENSSVCQDDPNSQRIQHTIHPTLSSQSCGNSWTGACGENSPCTAFRTNELYPGADDAWWSTWHVFKGYWSGTNYHFYIDTLDLTNPTQVGSIGAAQGITPASIPGEVILSLLVSENGVPTDEYNQLQSHLAGGGSLNDFKMYIDWIRVWR